MNSSELQVFERLQSEYLDCLVLKMDACGNPDFIVIPKYSGTRFVEVKAGKDEVRLGTAILSRLA